MNELFIILPVVAIFSLALISYLIKNVQKTEEKVPKEVHQVRKLTFIVSEKPELEKPKRKKKKYYNKKNKPVVAENAPTEKRPVGRPRKTTE